MLSFEVVLGRELRQAAEVRPRRFRVGRQRGHRHQSADRGVSLQVARDLARRDPGLGLLAREVDLEQRRNGQPRRGRVGREGVDELAESVDDLDLVRLQVADEMPAEGIAIGRMLSLEILRTVLSHDLHPGLDQNCHLVHGDVLRGDDDGDSVPDLLAYAAIAIGDLGGGATLTSPTRRR